MIRVQVQVKLPALILFVHIVLKRLLLVCGEMVAHLIAVRDHLVRAEPDTGNALVVLTDARVLADGLAHVHHDAAIGATRHDDGVGGLRRLYDASTEDVTQRRVELEVHGRATIQI